MRLPNPGSREYRRRGFIDYAGGKVKQAQNRDADWTGLVGELRVLAGSPGNRQIIGVEKGAGMG